MQQNSKTIALLILIGTLLTTSPAYATENPDPQDEILSSVVGEYLSGGYATRQKDTETAAKIFLNAIKKTPQNPIVLKNSYELLLSMGEIDNAVTVVRDYIDTSPADAVASILLASYEVEQGEFGKAEIILDTITRENKLSVAAGVNKVITPFLKLWTKIGQGKQAEAIEYSRKLIKEGDTPSLFLYYQDALINDLIGNKERAEQSFDKVSKEGIVIPYHFVHSAGNFYERIGKKNKAKALYDNYREQYPHSGYFDNAMERLESEDEIPDRIINNAQEGFAEVLAEAARVLYSSGYYEDGLVYVRLVLFLKPEMDEAKFLLGTYFENFEQYKKAVNALQEISRDSDFYITSRIAIAEDLYKFGQKDKAIKKLTSLTSGYEPSRVALLTLADLLRKDSKYEAAAKVYTKIIDQIGELGLKNWPIFFARGICYERSGNWEAAEADLLKALELKPGQPETLNYLGYSWIDRDKNIEEAKQMVEAAVKARPDDAQIVDSMGWALYKTNEYQRASLYLERAVEITPYDAVINDHLGDTYWKLGRFNEARFQWNRVLQYNNSEDIDVGKIKKKLKNGLPDTN